MKFSDFPASPETEQLLSVRTHGNTPDARVRPQPGERWSSDETYLQGGVSSSRPTPRDKPVELNGDVSQIGETSNNPSVVIRLPSVITDDNQCNDDPPPYSAITPPNHVGWPYGIFSYSHSCSTDGTPSRAEIPLAAFFQGTSTAMNFHHEGSDGQHTSSFSTPYQFFKFGCRRNSVLRETSFPDNGIAEKIDDTKSRRYGGILVAAAVIIFLMALSLMVRFVMERSWWRA
ncbi:uncharacterized protein LOC105288127 isoform X2 [Ooceraea biroi]|uniref:uncharacterized protein LOC105288127 isoform X2 n=1 Tax=Ooceraea biroi TaxID=2015173 RepID=UPI0005B910B3|nr:uncharacterized protein LOC105288127 isoform X2 [Ooceraea biroi]